MVVVWTHTRVFGLYWRKVVIEKLNLRQTRDCSFSTGRQFQDCFKVIAGSLESANSSILAACRPFKRWWGQNKSGFYVNDVVISIISLVEGGPWLPLFAPSNR